MSLLEELWLLDPLTSSSVNHYSEAPWSVMTGDTKMTASSSGAACPSFGTQGLSYYSGTSFSTSQQAVIFERVLSSEIATRFWELWLCLSAAHSGYRLKFTMTTESLWKAELFTVVTGTETLRATSAEIASAAEQKFALWKNGTKIEAWYKTGAGAWTKLFEFTSSEFTSGFIGIGGQGSNPHFKTLEGPLLPTVTSPGKQESNEGSAITPLTLTHTNTASWTATSLPTGLSINAATGEITGTPTVKATFHPKVTVHNAFGTQEVEFEWVIKEHLPTVTNPGPQLSRRGTHLTLALSGTHVHAWTAEHLPAGLSISGSTGEISGTPTTVEETTVKVEVENTEGAKVHVEFLWTITPTLPTAVTNAATNALSWSATLNGETDPDGTATTAYFEWGPTTAYGNETAEQSMGAGEATVPVAAFIEELDPSTTYHYRLVSTNAGGTVFGADMSFTSASPEASRIILPAGVAAPKKSVTWDWYLAEPRFGLEGQFESFENIGLLDTATGRNLKLALNNPESASFSINTHDSIAPSIVPIETCIVCYRNGTLKWSGPVWTIDEEVADGQEAVNVTCAGWFQLLLERILKTGALGYSAVPGITKGVGPTASTTATSQTYNEYDPGQIVVDFLNRTNYEFPTGILPGSITPNPNAVKWNVTYQQFQNLGQAINQLANTEGGFDFRVDPATLLMNVYYAAVREGTTVYGRGQNRPNSVFGYGWGPMNLKSLKRTTDGSQLMNQMTAIGQFGASQYTSAQSVTKYGLFQAQQALSAVVSPLITTAFATAEVLARENPQVIYSFSPLAYHGSKDVPQPFDDYDVGDFVYLGANYGRMVVFNEQQNGPQPTRVFGFQVQIDDEGNEMVSSMQTTYTATS